ncbi:alpha/beta hydrolase [Kribbella endophytica]
MHRTLTFALAATAVAAVAVPAFSMATPPEVSAATTSVSTKPLPSTLKWTPCPADVVSKVALECSALDVPLDYRTPNGRQIEIAISRLASKEPTQRRGVLLTNPGGPGGSGLAHIGTLATTGVPREVLNAYDLIGFDPRGVAHSTPVSCNLTPAQQAAGAFPTYANSPADVAREAKFARTVAKQCTTSKTASMLPHITTANTARDMDRIRIALGEKKASYFGTSYGSYLGAVYTTLFPKTTDRVLLDSVTGPKGYGYEQMRMFARGMQDRFPDFAKWAAANPSAGLGSTPQEVTAKYYELAQRIDKLPVQGVVTGTLFRGITFEKLYGDAWFPTLAKIWKALDAGRLPPDLIPEGDFERDPGTAIAGAKEMHRAFGQRARMVTVDGGGHGAYPWGNNTCGNDAVTKFLLTGERPANVLACAPNPK